MRYKQMKMSKDKRGFSIIMNVYDQAPELEANLPQFLTQDYEPGFEVIVVNEMSTDNTDDVLKLLKQDYPNLYTTFLPKPNRLAIHKKHALNIGAKAAKNEWLIFASINKVPAANDILTAINEVLDDDAALTLGYIDKKGIRLQPFYTIDEASGHIRKTERKLQNVKHRNTRTNYMWGRYDFIIIPKSNLLELLKFYEHVIHKGELLGIRLGILWHNLIHHASTTLLVTT